MVLVKCINKVLLNYQVLISKFNTHDIFLKKRNISNNSKVLYLEANKFIEIH